MRREPPSEIGEILIRIPERIRLGVVFERVFGNGALEMFERHGTFKAQLTGGAFEGRDRNRIIERIMKPTQIRRLRGNRQPGADQPEIVTFARPEHHAMLAQTNGFRIAIDGRVMYRKQRHQAGSSGISSVQTLKLSRVFGPNVVAIATSDASRPRAIKTRAIRGTLLRGSKVCQRPPR